MTTKTVHFRCESFHEFFVVMDSSDHSDDNGRKCACGKHAKWFRIAWDPPGGSYGGHDGHVFVKNRPYAYGKWNVPNIGRFHRTDQQQDELYAKRIKHARQRAHEQRKSLAAKDDVQWEHVGRMPLEMHESIVENENNRHVIHRDPEYWLKKTGCWLGE